MSRSLPELPFSPRGEGIPEDAEMLASMEQIVRHALQRTEHWKTPPNYSTDYWCEERVSIATIAVWNAIRTFDPDAGVSFPVYAFYSAVQAIRREHRRSWRWSLLTAPLPHDEASGEDADIVDPCSSAPFEGCETACDLQRALQTLSGAERDMLGWWAVEGLTEREIAQRLHLSKTAVHKKLVGIRRRLQSVLSALKSGE